MVILSRYEPDKRSKPVVIENIPKLKRKEKSIYKPSDLWTQQDDLLFLKYCPTKRENSNNKRFTRKNGVANSIRIPFGSGAFIDPLIEPSDDSTFAPVNSGQPYLVPGQKIDMAIVKFNPSEQSKPPAYAAFVPLFLSFPFPASAHLVLTFHDLVVYSKVIYRKSFLIPQTPLKFWFYRLKKVLSFNVFLPQ